MWRALQSSRLRAVFRAILRANRKTLSLVLVQRTSRRIPVVARAKSSRLTIRAKHRKEIISQRSEVEPPQVLDAGAEAKVEAHAKRGTQKKSARGSLSNQAISDVVRAGYRPLLACVNSVVPPGQVMALTTKVKFTISPKGTVQKYAVVDGGSGNKAIDIDVTIDNM